MMEDNTKGFLKYYDEYKDKIYNFFWYRMNFNRDIAEDLTQEVFIKAFSHFDSFDETRSFQAWIYRIARNHLINHLRTLGREVSLDNAADLFMESMADEVYSSLEVQEIIVVIRQMDEYSREVLLLKYVDGLNSKEIATAINKSDAAVRTHLSRAMNALKEKLNEKFRDKIE